MTLKERRKAAGYTQQELGTMIGVDQSTIHLWEAGKTKPRKAHLAELAKLYKCSEKELTQDLDQ